MPSPLSASRLFLIPMLCAGCLLASFARAQDSSSLITQAQEQLQTEHYAEALTLAQEAVRRTPDDYRGHYYVAMACMVLGGFDEADAAVTRAHTLAPENARDAVQKLRTAIATNRQGEDKAATAKAALDEGLLAKAARLYREAWNAQHAKPELALTAADLYANRLGETVTAATLWREVIAAHQGTQPAEKAQVQLDRVTPLVKQIALLKFQASKVTPVWEDEIRLLAEAQAADPTNGDIYLWRAERASRSINPDYFKAALKDLARVGLATDENLVNIHMLAVWLDKPGFSDFLSDVIGAATVERLKTTFAQKIAAIEAEQARLAAARLAANKREQAESEARQQAETAKLDRMERQLAAARAAVVPAVNKIKALRKTQWADFIKLLRGSIIEEHIKVKTEKGLMADSAHFFNQVNIGQDSVAIYGRIGGAGNNESVVVTPGHFIVRALFENYWNIWQMAVSQRSYVTIREIGEPDVSAQATESMVYWNANKYNLAGIRAQITAIVAQQDKMKELHEEISELFKTIPQLERELKAGGRKVIAAPIYSPTND